MPTTTPEDRFEVLNADGLLIETQPTWELACLACYHLAVQGLLEMHDVYSVERADGVWYAAYATGTGEPRIERNEEPTR